MKLSDKRQSELFGAISDPIVDLRILQNDGLSVDELDAMLFSLSLEIHKRVKFVLSITEGAE